MNIYNYFFIGIIFTLLVDLFLNKFRNNALLRFVDWGWGERILCIIFWPIGLLIFLYNFLKKSFK